MLNGILYQWLNRQHGNTGMQSGIVDGNLSLQFRTEPEFLNFQVSPDNFHLLLDFDKCAIRAARSVAALWSRVWDARCPRSRHARILRQRGDATDGKQEHDTCELVYPVTH